MITLATEAGETDAQEIAQLEALIGEEISTGGYCAAEDEAGIAHDCPIASFEGTLKQVNHYPRTGKLRSVILECRYPYGTRKEEVSLDLTRDAGDRISYIERRVSHNNQLVLEVSSRRH